MRNIEIMYQTEFFNSFIQAPSPSWQVGRQNDPASYEWVTAIKKSQGSGICAWHKKPQGHICPTDLNVRFVIPHFIFFFNIKIIAFYAIKGIYLKYQSLNGFFFNGFLLLLHRSRSPDRLQHSNNNKGWRESHSLSWNQALHG